MQLRQYDALSQDRGAGRVSSLEIQIIVEGRVELRRRNLDEDFDFSSIKMKKSAMVLMADCTSILSATAFR